jgi:5-methylcytosine-specific restriction protein B
MTDVDRTTNKVREVTATDLGYVDMGLDLDEVDFDWLHEETSFDTDDIEMWLKSLMRKKQMIFYGPPGTGKTYVADKIADAITEDNDGFTKTVQFHQSYEYEDFIQGIRPDTDNNGNLNYGLEKGTFLEFCKKAEDRIGPCVLILDEINRADVSSVFGELMYLLEYRDEKVQLAQHKDDEEFGIPDNVYILGTMNTADRSIALVDFALRRRFAFIPLYPNFDVLEDYYEGTGVDVSDLIDKLEYINEEEINDQHYRLGYTYFLDVDLQEELPNIWKLEIEPYLEEYFVDDRDTVDEYRWNNVEEDISL